MPEVDHVKKDRQKRIAATGEEHPSSDVTIREELRGVFNRYAIDSKFQHHIVTDAVSPVMGATLVNGLHPVITGGVRSQRALRSK